MTRNTLAALLGNAYAIVPQTINTGRAALNLDCRGVCAYLDVLTDEVALWAIPGSKVDLFVKRVAPLAESERRSDNLHQMRRKDVEDGKRQTTRNLWRRWQARTKSNSGKPERVRETLRMSGRRKRQHLAAAEKER